MKQITVTTLYFPFHISRTSKFFSRRNDTSSAANVTAMFTSLRQPLTNSKSRLIAHEGTWDFGSNEAGRWVWGWLVYRWMEQDDMISGFNFVREVFEFRFVER